MTKSNYTLYHDDCLNLMGAIAPKSINLILCDLPYGITQASWDVQINLNDLWFQYERILATAGNIVLFGSQPFTSVLILSNPSLFSYSLIWIKNKSSGHLNAEYRPLVAHEDVLVFNKPRAYYSPVMSQGSRSISGTSNRNKPCELYGNMQKTTIRKNDAFDRYPNSVLHFPIVNNETRIHPTQKPVDLLMHLIKQYCPENGSVLDNAMGSAASIEAAYRLHRTSIGIEKNKAFFNKAVQRMNNISGRYDSVS